MDLSIVPECIQSEQQITFPGETMTVTAEKSGSITIVPTGQALGADVVGFDMNRKPTAAERAILEKAWADHLVLRFRGQAGLSVEALAEFSRIFGKLDQRPI